MLFYVLVNYCCHFFERSRVTFINWILCKFITMDEPAGLQMRVCIWKYVVVFCSLLRKNPLNLIWIPIDKWAATWDFQQCGMSTSKGWSILGSHQNLCLWLSWATDRTSFGVSILSRLHMLIWVYTCQNAPLLIACHCSNVTYIPLSCGLAHMVQ